MTAGQRQPGSRGPIRGGEARDSLRGVSAELLVGTARAPELH